MGTKLIINEFIAYTQLGPMVSANALQPKSIIIATFALCGFANFSSIAMLVGGIGEMIPERKHELAKLGFPAMICGTLASYLSASLAGIFYLHPDSRLNESFMLPMTIMLFAALVIIVFNMIHARRGQSG